MAVGLLTINFMMTFGATTPFLENGLSSEEWMGTIHRPIQMPWELLEDLLVRVLVQVHGSLRANLLTSSVEEITKSTTICGLTMLPKRTGLTLLALSL